jgi:hypothetical protein
MTHSTFFLFVFIIIRQKDVFLMKKIVSRAKKGVHISIGSYSGFLIHFS